MLDARAASNIAIFKPGVRAWFLEITSVQMYACVCVCVLPRGYE